MRLFFLVGSRAAAPEPICAFLCKLHNFRVKIYFNFVHIIFPFSLDFWRVLWYNIIVVKGRRKQPKRMAQMERRGKNRALQ